MELNLNQKIQGRLFSIFGYIYVTTNIINGKKYVGQKTSNVFIKRYLGSGLYIKNAIKKYGTDCFKVELIDFAMDKKSLDILEIYYINKYNTNYKKGGYNISIGGTGAQPGENNIMWGRFKDKNPNYKNPTGFRWSQEDIRKMRYKRSINLNNKKEVVLEDLSKGKIYIAPTIKHAAAHIGCNYNNLRSYLNRFDFYYNKGYKIYKNYNSENLNEDNKIEIKDGFFFKIYDKGKVSNIEGYKELECLIGVDKNNLRTYMSRRNYLKINDVYIFKVYYNHVEKCMYCKNKGNEVFTLESYNGENIEDYINIIIDNLNRY